MTNAHLLGLLAIYGCALGTAFWVYRRTHDVVDPRVVFPLVYALLTSGPVLWYLWSGEYYVGIVREMVLPVLLCTAISLASFGLGCSLVLRRSRSQNLTRRGAIPMYHRLPARRSIIVVLAAWVCLLLYMYFAYRLRGMTEGVKILLDVQDQGLLRSYYLSAALVSVFAILYATFDSHRRRGRISLQFVMFIIVYMFACLLNGERDVAIPAGGWIIANLRYWSRRRTLLIATSAILFVAIIPITRSSSPDFAAQAQALNSVGFEVIAGSFAMQTSSNLFVFSQVASWIPEFEDFRLGRTYLTAILSFVPFLRLVDDESPLIWFKNRYAPSGTTGYGFALDAEAYLNFGWLGPPLFFFLWGSLLGWVYRGAHRFRSTSYQQYLWLLILMVSIFSIRADSRSFLKLILYGAVVGRLIYAMSPVAPVEVE